MPEDAAEEVVVGRITQTVVKWPACCALLWFTVAFIWSMLGIVVIGSESTTFFRALGAPEFRPLSDNVIQRGQALEELQVEAYRVGVEDDEEDEDPDRKEKERSFVLDGTTIVYEDLVGSNLLTKASINKVVAVEKAFMSVDWKDRCLLVYTSNKNITRKKRGKCASPITILNTLYRDDDKHKELCEDGWCSLPAEFVPFVCGVSTDWGTPPCVSNAYDWRDGKLADRSEWPDLIRKNLCKKSSFDARSILDADAWECDEDEDEDAPVKSAFLRSSYRTGWPIQGFKNTENRSAQTAQLSPVIFGQPEDRYGARRRRALGEVIDPISATASEASQYVGEARGDKTINVLWDDFFGLTGRFGDVLFQDLLYAIASMVFVFVYIWVNVGSVVIAIAGITEILLSLPMALTFWRVIMQQERVDFLFFLSVYLILCIGADDIFVFMDSWKASASAPPHISNSLETRLKWSYQTAATAMLTTTSTTVLCLLLTTTSTLPSLRSFGIFVALVVFFDYCLVITWLPCVVLAYTKYILPCCPSCGLCCKPEKVDDAGKIKERPAVVFLRNRAAPFMHKYRFGFLALSAALSISMLTTLSVEFRTAEDTPFFVVPTHPLSVLSDINRLEFYNAAQGDYQITVMYGLDKDRPFTFREPGARQINPFSVDDVEKVVEYAEDFELTEALQEAIVNDCDQAKTYKVAGAGLPDDLLVDEEEVYCVLNDLKKWKPGAFPYSTERDLASALKKFYKSGDYDDLVDDFPDYRSKTGFVLENNNILALWNSFNTTIPVNTKTGASTLRPYFEAWEKYQDEACASPCLQFLPEDRFQGASWNLYVLLIRLAGETITTIGASIACAFVVLLVATKNVWTTAMVIVTIISAIVSMLACIFASGLSFGPQESLYTVLTIGLSIDYAVHVAHFYEHSDGSRFEKAQGALSKIAISVAGGAVTTVFAGLPLFGCNQLGLYLFGFFIFFTSFWAFVMTFCFLVPAFMAFGPEGSQGKYVLFIQKMMGKDASSSKTG